MVVVVQPPAAAAAAANLDLVPHNKHKSLGGDGRSHRNKIMMNRIPLSYIVLAVFCAALGWRLSITTYVTSQFKPAGDEAGTKSFVEESAMKNKPLSEERWNIIKQMSCPKQVPRPSIWPTLFTQARIELGFDINKIPNTPQDKRFVKAFFSFNDGGVGYTSLDGEHHLVYLRIWKSANDQIRNNINLVARKKDNLWDVDQSLSSPIPLSKRNQTCVVTAVRDPVEHFLSAYNEIEYRSTDSWRRANGFDNVNDKSQRYFERYENGTDARFERYVAEFIFGASSTELSPSLPPYIIWHAFSQTGVLWLLKRQKALLGVNAPRLVAYLPSVSNISATFPNLVATNCPGFEEEFGRPFNKQFDHKSSKDEKGFYAAAKRVWSKQGATSCERDCFPVEGIFAG